MDREADMRIAASMYYLQDLKMEAIAARLHRSRSSVSRLLKQARADGVVEIALRPSPTRAPGIGTRIVEAFGVSAHVVPVPDSASAEERLDRVAMTTARMLGSWVDSEMVLGVAWGTTLGAIAAHLPRKPTRGTVVVQLNGAANTRSSGVEYVGDLMSAFGTAFEARVQLFPVPAFFDFAETRRAMWAERSISRVLDLHRTADLALFSIGALGGEVPSHVYAAGYLDRDDVAMLADERVVGDVCTVFLRGNGTWEDLAINERATGPTPEQLRAIPRRVCAVAGDGKVTALLAALRAGVVTDLIVDELTAQALLHELDAGEGAVAG